MIPSPKFFSYFFKKNVYLFSERGKEKEQVCKHAQMQWGAEREGERESQAGSALSPESGAGLDSMSLWDCDLSQDHDLNEDQESGA